MTDEITRLRGARNLLREDLQHMEELAEQYLFDANKLAAERDKLREALRVAWETLKPMVKAADSWPDRWGDNVDVPMCEGLTVGDLRRARTAVAQIDKIIGGE